MVRTSNKRLRPLAWLGGTPSTAASSWAVKLCMDGGQNVTVAYMWLWLAICARDGSTSNTSTCLAKPFANSGFRENNTSHGTYTMKQ